MNHHDPQDAVHDRMVAEALGELEGPDRERLHANLATDPGLRAELASLRETVGALGYLPAPAPLPEDRSARLRTRLVTRAATASRLRVVPGGRKETAAARPSRRASWLWGGSGWAAAAMLMVLLATHHTFHESLAFGWVVAVAFASIALLLGFYAVSLRRRAAGQPSTGRTAWLAAAVMAGLLVGAATYGFLLLGEVAQQTAQVDQLLRERDGYAAALEQQEARLDQLIAPSVRVVNLAAPGTQDPYGRMFWNPDTDQWSFFAYNLPVLAEGRTYQLWLVADGQPVSAGTFGAGPEGRALVQAEYPLDPAALDAVAVSDEPEGGVEAPTGAIIISGEAEE